MNRLLAISALALCAHAAPALAESCTDISAVPATLSAPGKYCLNRDFKINSATANAITIASNEVTLDCQGHTLKNDSAVDNGSSSGIYLNSRNSIVIRNCRVLGGFASGIKVFQDNAVGNKSYYVNVEDNYIAGPYQYGILAYGSAIELSRNRVYDIGGQANSQAFGIRVSGSTASGPKFHLLQDNLVAGTTSPYNSAFGIYSDNSLGGIFLRNGVTGTAALNASFRAYGIRIGGESNRITDNHVVGSGRSNETGIYSTSVTTACFDNFIRAAVATATCDGSLGNY